MARHGKSIYTDDFTVGSDTNLDDYGTWYYVTNHSGSEFTVTASTDELDASSADDVVVAQQTRLQANQYAQVVKKTGAVSQYQGAAIRCGQSVSEDCYFNLQDDNQHQVWRIVGGSLTQIGAGTNPAGATDDIVRLEMRGTNIKSFLNDTEEESNTDSSHADGRAGIYMYGASAVCDDFECGNLGVAMETDAFTRGSDENLTAGDNWDRCTNTTASDQFIDSTNDWLEAQGSGDAVAYYSGNGAAVFSDEQYAEVDCNFTATGGWYMGPAVRCAPDTGTPPGDCFAASARGGSVGTELLRFDSSSFTIIASDATDHTNALVRVRIEAKGTTIVTFLDGLERDSATDSNHPDGFAGVYSFELATDASAYMDDWEGGNLDAAPDGIQNQRGRSATNTLLRM